jgi:hypothetical protein
MGLITLEVKIRWQINITMRKNYVLRVWYELIWHRLGFGE